jgi:hypothetical protein
MATIRRQYFNPKLSGSYSGASGFIRNRKITDKSKVLKQLKTLPTYSLHAPARKVYPRRRIVIPFIDRQWVADLIDMQKFAAENRGFRYIVVILDGFSKWLFTLPIKDKTGASLVRAFKFVFKKYKRKPSFLQVDPGTEFLNKPFKALMKANGIQIFHTYSKLKAVLAERMIRTLRTRIERYFTQTGRNKYIDALPYFTSSYNSTYHSSIKMAPREVTRENELDVWLHLYGDLTDEMVHSTPKALFRENDLVRISKEKLVFEKGYKTNWSDELFRVKKVLKTRPITYTLEDMKKEVISGRFLEPELQLYSIPDTEKTSIQKKLPEEVRQKIRRSSRIKKT